MASPHIKARLKANSPQVGQTCPVSGVTFRVGDDVVICEKRDVAFSAQHWQETVSMWRGRCRYCGSPLESLMMTPSGAGVKSDRSSGGKVSVPIWVMATGGASLLVCGLVLGVLLLGGIFGGNGSTSTGAESQSSGGLAVAQETGPSKELTPTLTSTKVTQIAANPPKPTRTPMPRPTIDLRLVKGTIIAAIERV